MNTQLPITYRDYTIKAGEHTKFEFVHNEYDGPEDKRIGTGSTEDDCRQKIDAQVIDSLDRDIIRLEQQVEKLQKVIDEDTTIKLEGSIQIENLKKDLSKLNSMVSTQQATIDVLTGFIENAIKTFEYKFESDEGAFNYEQMDAYKDMKEYMLNKAGKVSSSKLRQVLGRILDLIRNQRLTAHTFPSVIIHCS